MCSDSYIFFRKNRDPFIKLNGKPEEKILKVQGATACWQIEGCPYRQQNSAGKIPPLFCFIWSLFSPPPPHDFPPSLCCWYRRLCFMISSKTGVTKGA